MTKAEANSVEELAELMEIDRAGLVQTVAAYNKACQGGNFNPAILDGVRSPIRAGFAVLVPAGSNHNIVNTGNTPLKLYTLYAPPNHRDGVFHQTRDAAEADDEHFDGKTTE